MAYSYGGRRRRGNVVLPAILSLAVLGLAATLFVLLRPTIGGSVTDDYTGDAIGGVQIAYGSQRARSDARGNFTLTPDRDQPGIAVTSPEGYACSAPAGQPSRETRLLVLCRPTTLSGTLRRLHSQTPLPGIAVRAMTDQGEQTEEAITDDEGRYTLVDVPAGARLAVAGPGFAPRVYDIGHNTTLDLELRPDIISGRVLTKAGAPIPDVTIATTGAATAAAPDGSYTLRGVPEGGRIAVRAPGYRSQVLDLGEATTLDVTMEPLVVKAIYVMPDAIISDASFNALLALVDRTEINAMVIDFKDESGRLLYDSKLPLAREIGAVHPLYDLDARLKILRQHNVYTIARIVCMLDPTLATKKPEWAVRNSKTGGIWKNANGVAWVNAMRPEVWQYNADIAQEAVAHGFDEIQYDYVRFPSDGDLDAIDLGAPSTIATRTDAIYNFLKMTHDALAPSGVALGGDIFGIALWDTNDNGIGQKLEKLAPALDYICPMIYPSHFYPGSLGFDIPNNHPYEVIIDSLANGDARITNARNKFRPWLQDFTYGPGIDYGPKEVRAQIQATYDFGSTGWLLWNANSTFTEGALKPGP